MKPMLRLTLPSETTLPVTSKKHFIGKVAIFTIFFAIANMLFISNLFSQTAQNFTSNGNFTVPAGVYSITVEAWGAGGAGGGNTTGSDGGGGGGGGAYSKSTISVTPGTVYTVHVGTGGNGSTGNGGEGGDSWFNNTSTVLAKGGNGGSAVSGGNGGAFGTGGAAASGIGTTKYSGGNGGIGRNNNSGQGGPGGSSAGTSSNGLSGASSWSTRNAGSAPNGGGDGGDGGGSGGNGGNGGIPGGAGGGAGDETWFNSNKRGGAGARGQVTISYTQPTYKSQLVSMDLGSSTWCRGETRDVTIQIKNIGTATWTDGVGGTPDINIGVKWNQNGSNWTDYYIRTDAGNLAPGQTGTYVLSLTASNNTGSGYTTSLATGNNNITFDVVYEGVSWFGDNNNNVGPGNTKFVSPTQSIVSGATANAGNTLAAICQGSSSTALGGSVGGSATGGTWSDGGVGGTFSNGGNISTTKYAPPSSFSGTVTLTLNTTGGACGSANASKTLTVNAPAQVNAGSEMDDICQAGTTVPLGGSVSGSATGGTWSSSAGGSFSPNANNLNATYTPPASFSGEATLTLTTTGSSTCPQVSASKVVYVTPAGLVNAGPVLSTICQEATTSGLGGSIGGSAKSATWSDGGIGGTFSNASDLNATWTSPSNFSGTATLTLTAYAGVCGSPSDSKTQVINSAPTNITASPAASTICFGSAQTLTGSAVATGTSAMLVDNFNGTPTFSVTGNSSGDRSQVWQKEANGTNVNSVATFTSPNAGSSMVATVGLSGYFGSSSVNTILTSGSINTSGFSTLSTLSYNHTYKDGNSGSGKVEISVDNGASWTTLRTYTSNQGSSGNFDGESISLASYANATSIRLRFNFVSSNQNFFSNNTSWWAVDDVSLDGVRLPVYSWSANTSSSVNGLPAGAGTASASNSSISVNPTVTTTYTLTATNTSTACAGNSGPIIVTVNPAPSFAAIADVALTTGSDGEGDCAAVYNWTNPSVNTNCTTTLNVAYTAGAVIPSILPANGTVTPGAAAAVSFSTGVTIVTYTATDANNNSATTSFKVTVTDNELPVITCPAEMVVNNTTGQCSATITLTAPPASDNCGVASVTNDHPSDMFNVGTTDVTWTVKDVNNNIQTCIQKVTVKDTELPTIVCSGDVSVNNTPGQCSTTVTLTAPATNDNCGVASVTNDHSTSNIFPVGTTVVKWTVTDNSGNIATCEQNVTVTDNEKPVITCPASFSTATGDDVAYATITLEQPVVTDNCNIQSIVNDHPSNQFTIGTNLVTWTATDIHNNTNTCIQTIVVNDLIEPAIAFNAPVNINNTPGLCLGSIDITYPQASDNSGHVTVTSNYINLATASIDPVTPLLVNNVSFPVGSTTIVWTATDPSNNDNSSTQTVTVVDNEKPTIDCPQDVVQTNDAGNCSAIINLDTPVTSDNCGVLNVVNDHPSNVFTVGETIVTWTVTDIHGNNNTCQQKVTVTDTELPTIVCAPEVNVVNDNGQCSATITLTAPVVNDNCGVATVINDHQSAIFSEGETIVTWTVTDVHGNVNTCTQRVVVSDNEAPVITASPDVNANNDAGQCGATINIIAATATDNCGVGATTGTRSDALALSDNYPVGTTTISWTVTDIHGNAAVAVTQTITVTDTELPVVTAPAAITVNNDAGLCGASIAITAATATDNCDAGVPVGTRNDGLALTDPYPVGATTIEWIVTDIHGNTSIAKTQTITVIDNELPVITTDADIIQTADGGICGAIVGIGNALTSDNCGVGAANGSRSDGMPLSSIFPVGITTITWTVTDIHGNAAIAKTQTVTITDNELPVITASADVTINNDAGQCGASVYILNATASDNCGVATPTGTRSDGLALTEDYPVGTTTISWTVTDIHGNAAVPVTQTVTVTDNELPVIIVANDISVNNDGGQCGALVNIVPATATDNCGVGATTGTRNDGLALTDAFPVGTTTITWSVSDIHGNVAITETQQVNVNDNELPIITASPDVIVNNDAGQCGAAIDIVAATATDNCGVDATTGTRSDNESLTNVYPVGTTTITWQVMDIHGNAAISKTQTITVTDNEPPVITTAADVTQTADEGQCGAIVTIIAATATDNCGVGATTGTRSDALALSDPFPVGTTTITWTVTDIHGNEAVAKTQTVTVTDDELPVITTAAGITQTADGGQCGAIVTIMAATATDNCGVGATTGTRSDALALSDPFPVGTTTITWTVTDIHGNEAVAKTQTVTVTDDELPMITTAAGITQTADGGKCGAIVTIAAATATDNCGVGATTGTRSDALALSDPYPVGTTTITWIVTDIHGNEAVAKTQTVTVTDDELPVITTAADLTQTADGGQCGAIVTIIAATATDNCGVGATTGTRSDALALSDPFPVGTTTITWTVTDIHGNEAVAKTQTVTVTDDELPVITGTPANRNVNNDPGICGAAVTWAQPTSSDNCAIQSLVSDHHSGDIFPVGTTLVTYTATDIHGNVQTSSFSITVTDNEKPTIVCSPNITLSACTPTATWSIPQTHDNCSVASVVQTAGPASGSTFANGTTTTITYRVTDAAGNYNDCSFTVNRIDSITIAGSNSNPVLYYGAPGDQTSTIKVIPGGGTAPYIVSITMNRPLKCNEVTLSGDETWVASSGTSSAITCGTNTQNPVTTLSGVAAGQPLSINVGLLSTGIFTATITDANGCTKTYTTTVYAEDVRCFAGKSGNAKVKICHQTNKGCHEICVDENAVPAHLAHGDFLGTCTANCQQPLPTTYTKVIETKTGKGSIDTTKAILAQISMVEAGKLNVKVMPNPTSFFFTLVMKSASRENIKINISDVTGRVIEQRTDVPANSSLQLGDKYRPGVYIAEIMQGKEKITIRLIKGVE